MWIWYQNARSSPKLEFKYLYNEDSYEHAVFCSWKLNLSYADGFCDLFWRSGTYFGQKNALKDARVYKIPKFQQQILKEKPKLGNCGIFIFFVRWVI